MSTADPTTSDVLAAVRDLHDLVTERFGILSDRMGLVSERVSLLNEQLDARTGTVMDAIADLRRDLSDHDHDD